MYMYPAIDQVTVHVTGKIDPSKTSLLHLPPKVHSL